MKIKKICLFGVFGWYNLGNNSSLAAFNENSRRFRPDIEISCICPNPAGVTEEFQIQAFPINKDPRYNWNFGHNLLNILSRVIYRVISEPLLWISAYKFLKDKDMLIMTGTGMLDDGGLGPFRLPYDIFRWSSIAKLCKTKLLFVSVGAGPIYHPLSRWFIRRALAFADYRSYRNQYSKDFLSNIGCSVDEDPIYPDLVFSLPESSLPQLRSNDNHQPIIGIGLLKSFRTLTKDRETRYQEYINKIVSFVSWLIMHHYRVRLLLGDYYLDMEAVDDVKAKLSQQKLDVDNDLLIFEPINSTGDLLEQLECSDIVVASRFHNIIFALMLNKPVISISYHQKHDALMAEMGLEKYCQPIEQFDVDKLIEQLKEMEISIYPLRQRINKKVEEYRIELDKQYEQIFNAS